MPASFQAVLLRVNILQNLFDLILGIGRIIQITVKELSLEHADAQDGVDTQNQTADYNRVADRRQGSEQ